MEVSSAAGSDVCVESERTEQSVLELLGQRAPADLLGDETQQRVVGVVVLVGGVGRELRRVPERDRQYLLRCPDLRRVGIQSRRKLRRGRVVVEAAAHLQQLCDGDVLAVGHIWNVVGDRVAELELAVLGEEHDQRRRHGLGVRGDPEMSGRLRRRLRAQLGGADRRGEVPLRGAQHHQRPGDHHLLRGGVDDGLKRGRIDGLQRGPRWCSLVAVVVAVRGRTLSAR